MCWSINVSCLAHQGRDKALPKPLQTGEFQDSNSVVGWGKIMQNLGPRHSISWNADTTKTRTMTLDISRLSCIQDAFPAHNMSVFIDRRFYAKNFDAEQVFNQEFQWISQFWNQPTVGLLPQRGVPHTEANGLRNPDALSPSTRATWRFFKWQDFPTHGEMVEPYGKETWKNYGKI